MSRHRPQNQTRDKNSQPSHLHDPHSIESDSTSAAHPNVLGWQQQVGNQAVQRLLSDGRLNFRASQFNGLPPVRGVPDHAHIIHTQASKRIVSRNPNEAVLDKHQREIQWAKNPDDTGAIIWRNESGSIVGILEVANNQVLAEFVAGKVTAAELVKQGKAIWSPMGVGAEAESDTESPDQGEEDVQQLAEEAEQETDSSEEVTEEEGQGLITVAADISTDFIPGVSNIKDAIIALTGVNPVTGEKVGWGGRILSGIFAIPGLGNLAKYGVKGGKLIARGLKYAGKGIVKGVKAAGRLGLKIGKGVARTAKSAVSWLGRKIFGGGKSLLETARTRMREIAEAKRVKQLEGPKGTVNDAASGAHPHDTGTPTSSGKTPDPVHAPTPGIPKGAEPTYGNGLSLGDIETQAVQKKPSYKGKDKLQPGEIAGDMPYKNKSSPKLPEVDTAGQTITYKEFDIKPYDGVNRGAERVVIGTDSLGNKTYYYTADHYSSWTQFEPKR